MVCVSRLAFAALVSAIVFTAAAAGEEPKYKFEDLFPVSKPQGFKPGPSTRYAVWYEEGIGHVRSTCGPRGPHSGEGTLELF
jgi:hypothetical protein